MPPKKEKKISPTFLDQVNPQLDIIRVPCTWLSWYSAYFVVMHWQEWLFFWCSFPLTISGLLTTPSPTLGKEQAICCSFLALEIPRTEEPGGLQSGLKESDMTEWLSNNKGLFTQLQDISPCNHGQPPQSAPSQGLVLCFYLCWICHWSSECRFSRSFYI